ncbi:MAG: hypothetical protein WHV66_02700 [Anaerolineales bacterium]
MCPYVRSLDLYSPVKVHRLLRENRPTGLAPAPALCGVVKLDRLGSPSVGD